jgi:hypothetical protein
MLLFVVVFFGQVSLVTVASNQRKRPWEESDEVRK